MVTWKLIDQRGTRRKMACKAERGRKEF